PISPTDCNAGHTLTPSISTASRKSHAATRVAIPTAPGPRWADGSTTPAAAGTRSLRQGRASLTGPRAWAASHTKKRAAELPAASRAEALDGGRRGVTLQPASIDLRRPLFLWRSLGRRSRGVRDFDARRVVATPLALRYRQSRSSISPLVT